MLPYLEYCDIKLYVYNISISKEGSSRGCKYSLQVTSCACGREMCDQIVMTFNGCWLQEGLGHVNINHTAINYIYILYHWSGTGHWALYIFKEDKYLEKFFDSLQL